MPQSPSPSRVASRHIASRSVIEYLIPQHDMLRLMDFMEEEKDEQASKLALEVYQELGKRLKLSDNEEYALGRLKGCIGRIGSWDAGTQRNNIFKAADLLGMKLPSMMFASAEPKTAVD